VKRVAFAPATVANVAVGFDLLGFPIEGVGDRVTVERLDAREVRVAGVTGCDLPTDPLRNTATVGLVRLIEERDLAHGFAVSIEKGIPLGSGMGGSAASAVGAIVAASALLDQPLTAAEQLRYALFGEEAASGSRHADNAAPCLLGGLTLTRSSEDVVPIPVPAMIRCVLVHPHARLDTRAARAVLRREVPLADHVRQSANLAAFIAGCFTNDLALIGRSLVDLIVEPQRAPLIRGFAAVKRAALDAGALGCSISGAGPSLFAWATDDAAAAIGAAMVGAFAAEGVPADAWISPIAAQGARVVA
jgi:homoserine kinase